MAAVDSRPLVLASATAGELGAATAGLGVKPDLSTGGFEEHRLAGRRVVLLVTGVGLINAAWSMGRLLERLDGASGCLGVLSAGIAGSYDLSDLALGEACVADEEIWPEYGLEHGHGADARSLGFPVDEDGPVYDSLPLDPDGSAQAMGVFLDPAWKRVAGVSVSTVSTSRERVEYLRGTMKGRMENMEGFALALAAMRAGVPFVEVRTISNLAGSRARGDWDVPGAFKALGRAVVNMLR